LRRALQQNEDLHDPEVLTGLTMPEMPEHGCWWFDLDEWLPQQTDAA
jgi:hypothetical protein